MLFIALCSNSLTTIVRKIMLFKKTLKVLPPLFNIATKIYNCLPLFIIATKQMYVEIIP